MRVRTIMRNIFLPVMFVPMMLVPMMLVPMMTASVGRLERLRS